MRQLARQGERVQALFIEQWVQLYHWVAGAHFPTSRLLGHSCLDTGNSCNGCTDWRGDLFPYLASSSVKGAAGVGVLRVVLTQFVAPLALQGVVSRVRRGGGVHDSLLFIDITPFP